jgi:4'-phosphopantetheinyl transferase
MPNKWSLIDVPPPLENDEVHLWRIDLEGAAGLIDRYASFLSAEEQNRANRFRIEQARDHFTIGRACLRILLGNALGVTSSDVSISEGLHGKPGTPAFGGRSLSFNVAHSKNTILIVLGRQGDVGVDVEYTNRSTDTMEVARGNFTENESNSLAAIADPETRLRTFYRYWTRKEAVVKADGRGLFLPLASFDVSFESADSQPVDVNEPSTGESKLYFVSDLELGDQAVGALALESSDYRVRSLIFPLALSWL